MTRYLLSRIGQALIVIWLAFTLIFIAVQALPSDPITIFLSRDTAADPATIASLQAAYGYDRPVLEQYIAGLAGVVTGDFGFSLTAGQAVTERIGAVIGSTVELAGWSILLTVVLALGIASAATLSSSPRLKDVILNLPAFFVAVPVFWLGLLALQLFSIQLGWMSLFPDGSFMSLAVPVFVLSLHLAAPVAQVLLKALDKVYEQPYIDVLRAKGASEAWIFFRHALKHAAAPALTVAGTTVGAVFAGSVITETVFSRSGLGQVVIQAVTQQDIPLLQGLVVLTALVFVVANLLVDLLYPVLDPRIITTGTKSAHALAV